MESDMMAKRKHSRVRRKIVGLLRLYPTGLTSNEIRDKLALSLSIKSISQVLKGVPGIISSVSKMTDFCAEQEYNQWVLDDEERFVNWLEGRK
jgi:hypothetical protein